MDLASRGFPKKALQRPTNSYDKWNSIGREEEYEELVTELKDVSSSVKDLGIPVKAEAGADAGDGGPLEITDGMSFQEMTEVIARREEAHKAKRNKIFEDILSALGGPPPGEEAAKGGVLQGATAAGGI